MTSPNAGRCLVGTMLRIACVPPVMVMAKDAGLDFVMVDMEHGPCSYERLADMAMTARAVGVGLFVRVPQLARSHVSRALDCGVTGVMAPMIETEAQARQLAGWAKYAPVGQRGVSGRGWHTGFASPADTVAHMRAANAQTLVIAQVETGAGAAAAREIAAVPGIDALLVGPNDLSCSLGRPGELESAIVQEAIGKVRDAAVGAGRRFGLHAGASLLKRWAPHGLNLIMQSTDIHILGDGMQALCASMRGIAEAGHGDG